MVTKRPAYRGGCRTKVTDRKLFVIEHQHHGWASKEINRARPAEAVRSAPNASASGGSPSRCCLAPTPFVCATATAHSETLGAGAKMPVRQQRQVWTKAVTRAGCCCFTPDAVTLGRPPGESSGSRRPVWAPGLRPWAYRARCPAWPGSARRTGCDRAPGAAFIAVGRRSTLWVTPARRSL
jgi:hypothetical protein